MPKNPILIDTGVVFLMDIASAKEKLSKLSNFAGGPGNF
jgi:hypothetical protein